MKARRRNTRSTKGTRVFALLAPLVLLVFLYPVGSQQAASVSGQAAVDAKTSRAFLDKYCVTCHNSRTAQPTADPVNLEKASLDDVLTSAETWERVLRKLSVRAMPPPGMARPQEAEYAGFTTWLANSLDQAWAA